MIPRLRSQKAQRAQHTHAQRLQQLLISNATAANSHHNYGQHRPRRRNSEQLRNSTRTPTEIEEDGNLLENCRIGDEMCSVGFTSPSSPPQPFLPPNGELNNGGAALSLADLEQRSAAIAEPTASGGAEAEQLRLNVGGRSAQLAVDKIRQRADRSRLAAFVDKEHAQRLLECDAYANGEYYFERSANVFENVVDYYVTGKLHRPMEICPIRWRDELEFWRIPLSALAECCRIDGLLGAAPPKRPMSPVFSTDNIYVESNCPPAEFEGVPLGRARLILWTFLENPRSSGSAKVLSVVSAAFVLCSLAGLILSSMREFQIDDGLMTPVWPLQMLEICCMLFFTLEYMLRFAVVPHKWAFVKQPLNIIDLLTIVPFVFEACLPLLGVYDVELRNFRGALIVIRVLRLARVARIFKLARYSIGLRAFGETMRKSAAELSMLGMFLLTGIMLFSTAIYFFERDEPNSKFYSIPSAWWWCVATMTTVGYGDLVPVTTGGKVVAAIASVCGIIVLAFPISMIIDKFAESTGHGQPLLGAGGADNAGGGNLVMAGRLPLAYRNSGGPRMGSISSPPGRGMSRRRAKSRRYLF